MKKYFVIPLLCLFVISCKEVPQEEEIDPVAVQWEPFDETEQLEAQQEHENERMRFKLINSKVLDKNTIWEDFNDELADFTKEKYLALKPVVMERSIPELQRAIKEGDLTYEDLVLFYIYRIRKFESDNNLSLNAVISLNPDVVEQARKLDSYGARAVNENSIYGMPVLLKDNIDFAGLPTTAGAIALAENVPAEHAFIVDRLLNHKALILGKVNLSEWAYYFCDGCPLGYSAIGGQTLNPYGRMEFETGGSSSGSGVAVAANYAAAAVGTETAGSILSPASQNSVVGLKPTVGLLSRSGIVPISSTLDTPGPMTRTVLDNAILLNAMTGKDVDDAASVARDQNYVKALEGASLEGKRFGVIKDLLTDSLYKAAVDAIRKKGAAIVEIQPENPPLEGFGSLLSADMKRDLPVYLEGAAKENLGFETVEDIMKYNLQDSLTRAPYGQALFRDIISDTTSDQELVALRARLQEAGRSFFETPMEQYNLDAVLSINNYHAAYAAVAKYPALAVPMGYDISGEPKNLTFIARPFEEDKLLEMGYAFEKQYRQRIPPVNYN